MKSDSVGAVWKDAGGENLYFIINYNSGLCVHSCLQTPAFSFFARNKVLSIEMSFLKSKGYVNLNKSHFICEFVQQVNVRHKRKTHK